MPHSRLSHRLSLCELIRKLDTDECLDVIRSIHQEFGCQNLNELLTKMILKLTDTTTADSFNKMKNIINDTLSSTNSKHNDIHKNCNNNTKQMQQSQNIENNNQLLLRLPNDLVAKTSSYLNEKDIFSFEKCCKLFYQIINNSTYLNQCNAFKTFILTPETLDQMAEPEYSFFKYSKATTLILQQFRRDKEHWQEMERQFQRAKIVGSCDNWLCSMFKSIKTLDVSFDGSPLLSVLPVEMMFDPIESNLQRFEMLLEYDNNVFEHFDQFQQKYLALKDKRVLNYVRFYELSGHGCGILQKVFCFQANYVYLDAPQLHILLNSRDCNVNINSRLRMVTFNCDCMIDFEYKSENENVLQLNIETLRFINLKYRCNVKLLYNERLIESLNLHSSVKQLTLNFICEDLENMYGSTATRQRWDEIVSSLFGKKYFVNLEKMNILFDFIGQGHSRKHFVAWIVGLMKQNKQILKHQFKQLNIGLYCPAQYKRQERYDIVQWNPQINDKFLDQFQTNCNKLKQPTEEYDMNAKKYVALKNKWLTNT